MKIAMKMSTNMRGLQKFHENNPRKSLAGYFIYNGRHLTNKEVIKMVNYAVEHGYETERDIPENELKQLFEGDKK